MTVETMFSVPIIYYPIKDWSVNKKRILDALPDEEGLLEPDGSLYTDFFEEREDKEDKLPSYAEVVIDIIKPYLADFTNKRRVEFTDMWFQTSYRDQTHGIHNHGHSGWSCVMYIEYDPKYHKPTTFYSPFNNPWSGRLQVFEPPVVEGDLIIFPSTVAHEGPRNTSDVKRTVISFNIRGKVDKVKYKMWDGDPMVYVRQAFDESTPDDAKANRYEFKI
tara:strand:+ start:1501 stop:2157 length:657 start_codon:yes stop_codon:yes gene_type:complete